MERVKRHEGIFLPNLLNKKKKLSCALFANWHSRRRAFSTIDTNRLIQWVKGVSQWVFSLLHSLDNECERHAQKVCDAQCTCFPLWHIINNEMKTVSGDFLFKSELKGIVDTIAWYTGFVNWAHNGLITTVPGQLPTGQFCRKEYSQTPHLDNFPARTTPHQDNFTLRQLLTRKIPHLELDDSQQGQVRSWIVQLGSCPCDGGRPSGELSRWELSWCGVVLQGSCPGWESSGYMGVVRVGVVQCGVVLEPILPNAVGLVMFFFASRITFSRVKKFQPYDMPEHSPKTEILKFRPPPPPPDKLDIKSERTDPWW